MRHDARNEQQRINKELKTIGFCVLSWLLGTMSLFAIFGKCEDNNYTLESFSDFGRTRVVVFKHQQTKQLLYKSYQHPSDINETNLAIFANPEIGSVFTFRECSKVPLNLSLVLAFILLCVYYVQHPFPRYPYG